MKRRWDVCKRTSSIVQNANRLAADSRLYRQRRGNMLVLIAACTVGILLIVCFFGLGYARLLGANNEQRTAIEAAALSAANDISRAVIYTPQFGYVGISDAIPAGAYTNDPATGDGYCMPVYGINTLLATVRLDLMIASVIPNVQANGGQSSDPLLMQLALKDLQNVYAVQSQLESALNDACQSGGEPLHDIQGNTINVYANALAAYQANAIRMTGNTSYVNGSLKLKLGCLTSNTVTNTSVPQGLFGALQPLSTSQQLNNFYKAYVDCPAGGEHFYFAAIGDAVKLVDKSSWVQQLPNVPRGVSPMPSVIKAEADQQYEASSNSFKGGTIHAAAAAAPSALVDPRPAPGIFRMSFPDGPIAEFTCLQDVFANPRLNDKPDKTVAFAAMNGDYPNPGTRLASNNALWPLQGASPYNGKNGPCPADYCKLAFYDWLRRGGTRVNVSSVAQMLTQPFNQTGPDINWNVPLYAGGPPTFMCKIAQGISHSYEFNSDGTTRYTSQFIHPQPYPEASGGQLYVEAIDGQGGFFHSARPHDSQGNGNGRTPSWAETALDNLTIPDPDDPRHGHSISGCKIKIKNKFDVYVRDYARVLSNGVNLGGRHAGEPSDQVAAVLCPVDQGTNGGGGGDPPIVSIVSDFAEGYSDRTNFTKFSTGSGGVAIRPTYRTDGLVAEVRFRRDIEVGGPLADIYGYKTGYLSEEDPPY